MDADPNHGSVRGEVITKYRFYGQIFHKNVIGRWRVPHRTGVICQLPATVFHAVNDLLIRGSIGNDKSSENKNRLRTRIIPPDRQYKKMLLRAAISGETAKKS